LYGNLVLASGTPFRAVKLDGPCFVVSGRNDADTDDLTGLGWLDPQLDGHVSVHVEVSAWDEVALGAKYSPSTMPVVPDSRHVVGLNRHGFSAAPIRGAALG